MSAHLRRHDFLWSPLSDSNRSPAYKAGALDRWAKRANSISAMPAREPATVHRGISLHAARLQAGRAHAHQGPSAFARTHPGWNGADQEVRTPGLDLGKVALYQLSLIRICRIGRHPVVAAVLRQLVKEHAQSFDARSHGARLCSRCHPRNWLRKSKRPGTSRYPGLDLRARKMRVYAPPSPGLSW